jgi:hypothetical protein
MAKETGALLWGKGGQGRSRGPEQFVPIRAPAARKAALSLAKASSIGLRSGLVGWQVAQFRPTGRAASSRTPASLAGVAKLSAGRPSPPAGAWARQSRPRGRPETARRPGAHPRAAGP